MTTTTSATLLSLADRVEAGSGVPHPSEFIAEELAARGWDRYDLAINMGGDPVRNLLVIDMYSIVGPVRTNCRMGERTAHQLAVAFDVSAQFFVNLEAAWLESQAACLRARAMEADNA